MLNEVPQTLLQLPFFRTRVEDGAHSLDKEKADQQGKNGCKQDCDFIHGYSPFVAIIRFEIQETVLARRGTITRLWCPSEHVSTPARQSYGGKRKTADQKVRRFGV
jgi:hypothetical protein